jgi:hypothetical protein
MTGPARLDRAIIAVTGEEAYSFLQNLLTQDMEHVRTGGVAYAALLSPQGKVNADMLLWAQPGGVLIEADPSRGADLLRRLSMYKLRAKVAIADASADFLAAWSAEPFDGGARDPRLPALGWRALRTRAEASALPDGRATYEALRVRLGAPDLARDAAQEEVFAGEALLEELNGVAFDKGCFIGQENVSRMKRRATTRKKFCPVVFEGEAIRFGAPVTAGAAEIGAIRTGATGRALALLRLDRAVDAVAAGVALNADGREIRLDPPPWLILPQREPTPG